MTNRKKVVLFSSILLAVSVIGSCMLYYVRYDQDTGGNKGYPFLMIALIAISILSVLIVYITKIKKRKYEKLLDAAYIKEYEVIKDAVSNSRLSCKDKKDLIEDILDLLVTGQDHKRSANDVIGDPAEFAEEMIGSYLRSKRRIILNIIDGTVWSISFILGTTAFLWLEQKGTGLFDIRIDISMLFFFLLVSFLVIPLTRKLTAAKNTWAFLIPFASGLAYIGNDMILRKYLYNLSAVEWLLDGSVSIIGDPLVLALLILLPPMLLLLKKHLRKKYIRI